MRIEVIKNVIGLKSNVVDSELHYLLFDCDSSFDFSYFLAEYPFPIMVYETPSGGHHVIVFKAVPFYEAVKEVLKCPFSDHNYISNAVRRGYFFLESHVPVIFQDCQYMRIERVAKNLR